MFNWVLITPLTQVYYTPIFSEAAATVVFIRLAVLQIFLKTHRKTPKKHIYGIIFPTNIANFFRIFIL